MKLSDFVLGKLVYDKTKKAVYKVNSLLDDENGDVVGYQGTLVIGIGDIPWEITVKKGENLLQFDYIEAALNELSPPQFACYVKLRNELSEINSKFNF